VQVPGALAAAGSVAGDVDAVQRQRPHRQTVQDGRGLVADDGVGTHPEQCRGDQCAVEPSGVERGEHVVAQIGSGPQAPQATAAARGAEFTVGVAAGEGVPSAQHGGCRITHAPILTCHSRVPARKPPSTAAPVDNRRAVDN